jgi:hypothetical protein
VLSNFLWSFLSGAPKVRGPLKFGGPPSLDTLTPSRYATDCSKTSKFTIGNRSPSGLKWFDFSFKMTIFRLNMLFAISGQHWSQVPRQRIGILDFTSWNWI